MELRLRTQKGEIIAIIKGKSALAFYSQFSEDTINFTKAVKTFAGSKGEIKKYDVFSVTSDMKIFITKDCELWLLAGSYVMICI